MKRYLIFFALSLFSQSPKEQALSDALLRQSTPANNPALSAYVQKIGAQLAPDHRFAVILSDEPQPFALPAKTILVPAQSVTNAPTEAAFLHALAHAIGHSVLRHGHKDNVFLRFSHQPFLHHQQFELAADRFADSLLQSVNPQTDPETFHRLQPPVHKVPSLLNH